MNGLWVLGTILAQLAEPLSSFCRAHHTWILWASRLQKKAPMVDMSSRTLLSKNRPSCCSVELRIKLPRDRVEPFRKDQNCTRCHGSCNPKSNRFPSTGRPASTGFPAARNSPRFPHGWLVGQHQAIRVISETTQTRRPPWSTYRSTTERSARSLWKVEPTARTART